MIPLIPEVEHDNRKITGGEKHSLEGYFFWTTSSVTVFSPAVNLLWPSNEKKDLWGLLQCYSHISRVVHRETRLCKIAIIVLVFSYINSAAGWWDFFLCVLRNTVCVLWGIWKDLFPKFWHSQHLLKKSDQVLLKKNNFYCWLLLRCSHNLQKHEWYAEAHFFLFFDANW